MALRNSPMICLVLLATYSSMGVDGCFTPSNPNPAPPGGALNVPFHRQIYPNASNPYKGHCVPASILMWRHYLQPGWVPDVPWQDNI
jgi:hypothetical protein